MFWLLACTGNSQTDTSAIEEEQSIPEGYEAVLIMPYEECSEPFEGDEEIEPGDQAPYDLCHVMIRRRT